MLHFSYVLVLISKHIKGVDQEAYNWSTKVFKKSKSKSVKSEQATSTKAVSDKTNLAGKSSESQSATATSNPSTQVIDTSYSEEPAWVKSLFVPKQEEVQEEVEIEKTFAADLAIAKPKPNRRPGGSINKFRDLARQLK